MGIEKPTGARLAQRLDTLSECKAGLSRLDAAARRKDTVEWKAQKAGLELVVKGCTQKVLEILSQTACDAVSDMMEMKKLYGQLHAAQSFIDEVEEAEKYKEKYRAKMKDVEAEIASLRSELEQVA